MFKGSCPALVTPFKNGELDLETLKKLVEWHIGEGTNGFVPVGTTGESPTLSHAEHDQVVAEVVKAAAGRVPVIAGTGSNNTVEAIRLTQHAEAAGAGHRRGRSRHRGHGGRLELLRSDEDGTEFLIRLPKMIVAAEPTEIAAK